MLNTKPLKAHKAIRFLTWFACAVLLVAGINYCFGAFARAHAGERSGGWWTRVSDTNGGAYTARYAFVSRGKILLRLYRTGDPRLLAERTFEEHGVEPFWTDALLIYDTLGDDGAIDLPPTRLDWLLAKLP